ncbi:MAG: aminotransferase class V-fold PLP-dependent enzyme, partial [Calditrichaeota bacterium]
AINKLSHRFPFEKGDVVITTLMEHHSNDLPWRDKAQVVRIYSDEKSPINPKLLQDALEKSQGRCKLVVVTGASNVTGLINPIYDLAKIAHQYGAQILVDAAQLAPHRKITMGKRGEEQSIDYLALSGHKMYAPFGSGALIGWPEIFEQGEPEYKGGGAVKFVSRDEIVWKEPPEKEEAGSPNVVGVVALAMAAKNLQAFGMDRVADHEAKLAYKLVEGMQGIPGIEFIGPETYNPEVRVGVIAFNVKGLHHAKTAAILSCEFGIAVRNGCFCAQPYLKQLLHFTDEQSEWLKNKIKNDEEVELPGAVRASFGVYNTLEEVDVFIEALEKIARGDYQGTYVPDPERGDYWPKEFKPDYQEFFNF